MSISKDYKVKASRKRKCPKLYLRRNRMVANIFRLCFPEMLFAFLPSIFLPFLPPSIHPSLPFFLFHFIQALNEDIRWQGQRDTCGFEHRVLFVLIAVKLASYFHAMMGLGKENIQQLMKKEILLTKGLNTTMLRLSSFDRLRMGKVIAGMRTFCGKRTKDPCILRTMWLKLRGSCKIR